VKRPGWILAALVGMAAIVAAWFAWGWYGISEIEEDSTFVVPQGATLTSVAVRLMEDGHIPSDSAFLWRASILGSDDPVKAGEFMLPAGSSPAGILDILQHGQVIRRFVTIPEGLPSVMVHDRLVAEELLTGTVEVPAEGSVLPESYDFERGEPRSAVVARMQAAMEQALAEAWANRAPDAAVSTPREALILASVIEKETALAEERRMVAGVLSNRLRIGMQLGADATTIYPITKGRPLGRQIRVSELRDRNPYNTRAIAGLPAGPITNPGRASIEAAVNPAKTDALYYVADGSGGHAFSRTLDEHNARAAQWRRLRRERGEIE
jgi:UPF0755 protein